jgi:hypothetical protein
MLRSSLTGMCSEGGSVWSPEVVPPSCMSCPFCPYAIDDLDILLAHVRTHVKDSAPRVLRVYAKPRPSPSNRFTRELKARFLRRGACSFANIVQCTYCIVQARFFYIVQKVIWHGGSRQGSG